MYAPKKHALFVALPAFGHITPMLELAKKLTHHNFHITFAVSEAKVQELEAREFIPKPYRASIEIYSLRDGLPADIDTRPSATHQEEMQRAMEGPLGELLETMPMRDAEGGGGPLSGLIKIPVDVVICDTLMYQPPTICARRGLPSFACHTSSPIYLTMLPSDWSKVETIPDEMFLENYDSAKDPRLCVSLIRHLKKMQTAQLLQKAFIVNGFEEMDPELLEKIKQLPETSKIKFIGPLLQKEEEVTDPEKAALAAKVTNWLNLQPTRSVMYLSFGSMVFPAPKALRLLGEVLLSLGTPFIFSLRESQQVNLPDSMQAQIAQQFDRPNPPFLVVPWARQQQILAHPATKLFVSHCGYNSTLETLAYGKPVVAWPFFCDQPMDADYLVRIGMAIKISNTGMQQDHLLDKEELKAALTAVGGSDGNSDCSVYFKNAQEMAVKSKSALAPGGSSYRNFQDLLELLRQ